MSSEERRKKFVELAEKRVERTLKDIRLIGNLSNRSNYSYRDEDVRKILRVLSEELKTMKARFDSGGDSSTPKFKL